MKGVWVANLKSLLSRESGDAQGERSTHSKAKGQLTRNNQETIVWLPAGVGYPVICVRWASVTDAPEMGLTNEAGRRNSRPSNIWGVQISKSLDCDTSSD